MKPAETPKIVLRTDRLILREFIGRDAITLHSLLMNPAAMKFSGSGVLTWAQTQVRLDQFIASYATHGFGKWAVTRADSGAFVGYCGVEVTHVDDPPVRELGFRYLPEFWGNGYGSEAGRAVVTHCFNTLGWDELTAFVEPENTRSVQLLLKLGFRFERATTWEKLLVHRYCATP